MAGSPLPALFATALITLVPSAAHACAVCFSGEEEGRIAYIAMTAFLTFLPLAMVGFGIYMLRRHILRKQGEVGEPA